MFATPFQKLTNRYVELEFRRGITAGEYAFAKVKFGSLKKKDLEKVLGAMYQMTEGVPQIPTQRQTNIPVGYRKVPVTTGYVSE